jgi:predicted aldo/keto reductase-like oxidoreductase
MSEAELATIEEVAASYRRLVKVGCTGCSYCMPCPSGVSIPVCFSLYNDYSMGNSLMARGFYGMGLMGGMGPRGDASLCINCGKCAKACPQHIAIPSELKKVNSTLGGLRTKILLPFVRMMFSSEVKE